MTELAVQTTTDRTTKDLGAFLARVGKDKPPPRRTSERAREILRKREAFYLSLIPSLKRELLVYLTGCPENQQALAQEIDLALRYLLAQAIFLHPECGESLVDEILITGSVARANVAERQDPKYFSYPQSFARWAELEEDPFFKAILKDLARGPYDLDIKLVMKSFFEKRGFVLNDPLGYFAKEMSKCLVGCACTKEERGAVWRGRLPILQKGNLCDSLIEIKQTITSGGFPYIEIRFYRQSNQARVDCDQPLFVVHLRMMTDSVMSAMGDWRHGANADRDDAIFLRLAVSSHTPNSAGFWFQTAEAKQLIGRPIEVADPRILLSKLEASKHGKIALLSWAFRTLRIALMERELIDSLRDLPAGNIEELELAVLEKLFSSRSIGVIKQLVKQFAEEGITNLDQLKMVIKEFYLCLTISPHLTLIFIHLTEIYKLIPYLSNMYEQQWQELLTSPQMAAARDGNYRILDCEDCLSHLLAYMDSHEVAIGNGFMGAMMAATAMVKAGYLSKDNQTGTISFWEYLAGLFVNDNKQRTETLYYPACFYS